jgi:septum formation protein
MMERMSDEFEWILASGSPRRRELLGRLVPAFTVVTAAVEEWEPEEADPVEQVEENARRKAQAVALERPEAVVIAADTTVALGRRLFAKPADRAEAVRMLRCLSGRKHVVVTGVAIRHAGRERIFSESSEVQFRELTDATIEAYLERVHVYDKAGAYAIQESGELIIASWAGAFENIMGLPVERLRRELVQLGLMEGDPE